VIKTFQQEFTDFDKLTESKNVIIADGLAGFRAVELANTIYRITESKQPICLDSPF